MNVGEIVNSMVQSMLTEFPDCVATNSFSSYVREFRTIGLTLPRQVGKTTIIRQLSDRFSSLTIAKNTRIAKDINDATFPVATLIPSFRGIRIPRGLKYQCVLIDEYDFFTEEEKRSVYEVIEQLRSREALMDNFFVLYMTSPRR